VTLIFNRIRFDETLYELEESEKWLKSLGIDITQSRFSEILNLNRNIVDHQKRNDIDGLLKNHDNVLLYFALTEASAFVEIHDAFKSEKSHLLRRSQLKKIIGGPFFAWDEPAEGDNARNTLFELETAAKLKKTGVEIRGFDDVDFIFERTQFNIQCKRIHSQQKISDNIKDAADQFCQKLNFNPSTKGIICLSIDKLSGKEKMFLKAKNEHEIGQTLGHLSGNFIKTYRDLWQNLLNINILGAFVFVHVIAIMEEEPFDLLTTCRNIDLDIIPQREYFQITDYNLMRKLADKLGGTPGRI